MKKTALPFATAGALLCAVLLTVLNLLTTPGVLWCVCAALALAGWPLGVWLCQKKRYAAFAFVLSLLLFGILAALNWLASPRTLWFPYAAPALLFAPVWLLKDRQRRLRVLLPLGALTVAYCLALNLLLTPGTLWAIHPIFAALMALYCGGRGSAKGFSAAGALLTVAYFIVCNVLTTAYPWALYACYPVVWWPLAVYFGKRLGALRFSVLASALTLAYYGALNLWLEPGSPWILFVGFALLWWPLSVFFHGKHKPHVYAAVMTALTAAFLVAVNLVYSPGVFWAFLPVFALLWWPLSVYFHGKHKPHVYAAVMTALTAAFLVAVNLVYSPGVFWAFLPVFALLWWPLTLCFARRRAWRAYAVTMSLLTAAALAAVNLMTSPGFLWCVFPALAILWWPLAMLLRGKPLGFSLAGAALVIGTLAAVNLMTSPGFLWCVFPALAILWWPAAVLLRGKPLGFSLAGAALVIGTLAAVNLMTSPGFLWCVFPALAILWWPLAVLLRGKPLGFSLTGAALVTATLVAVNLMTSPGFLWCVFPALAILWWPLAMLLRGKPLGFSLAGAALVIGTLAAVNLMTSPGFLWCVFPALAVLWWPAAVTLARKSPAAFSVLGCILVSALAVSVNLMTSPGFLWCVFPIFGVLWWPLGVLFHTARVRRLSESKP